MNLLFVKSKYIGDTLLLTGTLDAVKRVHPRARVTVAVCSGTEGILAGCAAVDRILTFSKNKSFKDDLALVRKVRASRFDMVFELGDNDRGRILALLSGARLKIANGHPVHMRSAFWRRMLGRHVSTNYNTPGIARALWDYQTVAAALALPATSEIRPVFDRSRADFTLAKTFAGNRPTLFVHPVASIASKLWGVARWTTFLDTLTPRYDIILSSGPAPSEIAHCEAILAGVAAPAAFRFTGGRPGWAAVAGLLYSSVAYIGADTAAMHLASACGVPVLGIFGGNAPEHLVQWRPAGADVRIVTFTDGESGIADIPVARIAAAFESLIPFTDHDRIHA